MVYYPLTVRKETQMARKRIISKGRILNFLYSLRCDTNWSIRAAREQDRGDEYIDALKEEAKIIDALVKIVKEKVSND